VKRNGLHQRLIIEGFRVDGSIRLRLVGILELQRDLQGCNRQTQAHPPIAFRRKISHLDCLTTQMHEEVVRFDSATRHSLLLRGAVPSRPGKFACLVRVVYVVVVVVVVHVTAVKGVHVVSKATSFVRFSLFAQENWSSYKSETYTADLLLSSSNSDELS
jgi:hypothetical protein